MSDNQQKILLHTCCAPCSIAIIEDISRRIAKPTVFFYNPNIHPEHEYLKRKAEVIRVCNQWNIPMVDLDYDVDSWEKNVGVIGSGKEGGPRCSACFRLRLDRTAEYAEQNGFSAFATSLTMSRRKNVVVINAIGQMIAEQHKIKFIDEVWRKGGRLERGRELTQEYEIYQQQYCGCRYSLAERLDQDNKKNGY